MAIAQTTITKAVGWARSDVILQLEEAFTWANFHSGSSISGIVTGYSSLSNNPSTTLYNEEYYNVPVATTSGIGTGATFFVKRSSQYSPPYNGTVVSVRVNRPGIGYTNGEYITLSAENIGGSAGGAVALGITVTVDGGASPVGYGTTNAFFDKNANSGTTYPWGVLKLDVDSSKKNGVTYWGFQTINNTSLRVRSGSSFHPSNNTPLDFEGVNRFAGISGADIPYAYEGNHYGDGSFVSGATVSDFTIAASNSYQLDLNVYRSGIDPKFAVFSYKQPTLSSTVLSGNSYATFILHNFTTPVFNLDEVFLGGLTEIQINGGDTGTPVISFVSRCITYYASSYRAGKSAEWGYLNSGLYQNNYNYKVTTYYSNSFNNSHGVTNQPSIYLRNSSRRFGDMTSASDYNAVIKGIPINASFVPCPYYLPDDFVLIDFDYGSPLANIQQGDTVTISGSEVYTVITGSYNQNTRTRGILFCARTV